MKTKYILLFPALLSACTGSKVDKASEAEPATEVTLTHVVFGHIPQEIILRATTVY